MYYATFVLLPIAAATATGLAGYSAARKKMNRLTSETFSRLDEVKRRSEERSQRQAAMQDNVLEEVRRNNILLEQQNQLLTEVLNLLKQK